MRLSVNLAVALVNFAFIADLAVAREFRTLLVILRLLVNLHYLLVNSLYLFVSLADLLVNSAHLLVIIIYGNQLAADLEIPVKELIKNQPPLLKVFR